MDPLHAAAQTRGLTTGTLGAADPRPLPSSGPAEGATGAPLAAKARRPLRLGGGPGPPSNSQKNVFEDIEGDIHPEGSAAGPFCASLHSLRRPYM